MLKLNDKYLMPFQFIFQQGFVPNAQLEWKLYMASMGITGNVLAVTLLKVSK